MYKSFEEELQDNRNRLQKKIRKQDIKRRITAIRQERLASQQMRVQQMNTLIDQLPKSLQKITVQLIEKQNYWLKGLLIDRIDKLKQCLELTNEAIDWKNVCFVLTDLMMSLPEKIPIVVQSTFKIVLSRALEEIFSSLVHKRPSQTHVTEYFLVALESCSLKDMPNEDFESLCKLIHKQLNYFDNDYAQIQTVVELIQTILCRDCYTSELSTKLSLKHLLIDICFVKDPHLVNKLFLICISRSDSIEDENGRLFITILQLFVNMTYYMAPNQQSCIQAHQIFCLLQIALKGQSIQTVHLGVKLLYNALYFRNKHLVSQASQFGIINKLLQLLKQSDQMSQGFQFVMDILEALSKYILMIDPNYQCQLMMSFINMDGLEAMLYSLDHLDLHDYQPDTIVMSLHAIRKLVCFLMTIEYTQQWKIVVTYEPYLEKLAMLDNSKIPEVAQQILKLIKQHLQKQIQLEFE